MTTKKRALDVQEGGNHYKKMPIQPVEYCYHNKLGVCESNIIKYVTRWRDKNGIQDLEKARHYIDLLIEFARDDQVAESDWPADDRIEAIGQNGNDGAVYEKQCWCEKCNTRAFTLPGTDQTVEVRTMMALCPQCGDKRCERAKHHDNECSAKKQYRDLEKPWEWQVGDYAIMEWQNHVAEGKITEVSENSDGELCFTVDSDDRPYVYSYAISVEARN